MKSKRWFIPVFTIMLVVGLTGQIRAQQDIRVFLTTNHGIESVLLEWDSITPELSQIGPGIQLFQGNVNGLTFGPDGTSLYASAVDHIVVQPLSGIPTPSLTNPGDNATGGRIAFDPGNGSSYIWSALSGPPPHANVIEQTEIPTGNVTTYNVININTGDPVPVHGALIEPGGTPWISDGVGNLHVVVDEDNGTLLTVQVVSGLPSGASQVIYDDYTGTFITMGTDYIEQISFDDNGLPPAQPDTSLTLVDVLDISGILGPGRIHNGASNGSGLLLFTHRSTSSLLVIDLDADGENFISDGIIATLPMPNGVKSIAPLDQQGSQAEGPQPNISPTMLDFGFVLVDDNHELSFRITNIGNSTLTVDGISPPSDDIFEIQGLQKYFPDGSPDGGPIGYGDFSGDQLGADSFFDVFFEFVPIQGDEDQDFNDTSTVFLIDNFGAPYDPIDVALYGTTNVPSIDLYFSDTVGRPGGGTIVRLEIENQVPIGGFEFKILPVDGEGDPPPEAPIPLFDVSPSEFVWLEGIINDLESYGFQVFHATDEFGVTTVLVVSVDGAYLEPGYHTVLELVYNIEEYTPLPHRVDLWVEDVIVADPNANPLPINEMRSGSIYIGIPGDIAGGGGSGDGEINVLDIITVIKYILGGLPQPPQESFGFWVVDANGDNNIDVLDLVWMINVYLYGWPGEGGDLVVKEITTSQPVVVNLDAAQVSESGELVIPLTLDADGTIAGLQATFTFDPSMMSIGTPQLAGRADGMTLQHQITDGKLQVIAYSVEGNTMPAGNGVTVLIPVRLLDNNTGNAPVITLDGVRLADAQAQAIPVTLGETSVKVSAIPTAYALKAASPNPFNPSTTISYEAPAPTHITLTVYNLLGQEVVRLVDQDQVPGRYHVTWYGTNARGQAVSSGVYLYRLTGAGYSETKRMTLLK